MRFPNGKEATSMEHKSRSPETTQAPQSVGGCSNKDSQLRMRP
jgi:hypothetical protein